MVDLVIGGAGFVGRNLIQRLESQGREVVVFDRSAMDLIDFNGLTITGDAQDPNLLVDIFRQIRPRDVYHLAANSDIASGVSDASLDFGDTLMTTLAVTEATSLEPVRRLIFASSSAIYGHVEGPLREENDQLPLPVSWYGKAKLVSELLLHALLVKRKEVAVLIVRFPNVVGPLATHGVVYDFVRKLRIDPTRLDVLGDGHQTKPYVHVSELLDGIQYFLQRAQPGMTRVNIGPPDLVSVREIVAEVCSVLNVQPYVTYQDSSFGWPGDVPRYEFDTSKMRGEGFSIQTSSTEAVRRAVQDLSKEWSV